MSKTLIAVDVGNSRIKLGVFAADRASASSSSTRLPEPVEMLDLPLTAEHGDFDEGRLREWLRVAPSETTWLVASVNRAAADRLCHYVTHDASAHHVQRLSYVDLPIEVRLPAPERVGIDRLAAAAAANRLRQPDRAAIIVDHGTAITVDLVDSAGEFVGGAILPGMALAAKALAEQTDALPHVAIDGLSTETRVIGDATVPAIEAGLFWGTLGAVRELVAQIASRQSVPPDVFITGGAAKRIADPLASATGLAVQHVPHLVLAGIVLANRA